MRLFNQRTRLVLRTMPKIWIAALLFGAAGLPAGAQAADPEAAAEAAAATWLALVDAGAYGRSWTDAASYVRQTVAQSAWASSVARARAACGLLKSRRLKSAYATSYLPDSPDGHYVVIHYASEFTHKPRTIETITAVEESPDHWRVIGYYIN